MPQELSPAVRRFQEKKARERSKAIARAKLRDEIKVANPAATPKQVEQIIDAHLRQRQVRVIRVPGNKRPVRVFHA